MILNIPMVITDEVVHIAFGPCRVLAVHGFNNNVGAGSDRYLQFHSKFPAALTNGDVPTIKSLYFPSGTLSSYGTDLFGPNGFTFSELLAAISSTEASYTAVTDTGLDLTIQVETEFPVLATTTIVGDLTTSVGSLQVWSEATGAASAKQLRRLDIVHSAGFDNTLIIRAVDSGTVADKNFGGQKMTSGTSYTYFFGNATGLVPIQRTAAGVESRGCTIRKASTSSGTIQAGATAKIRAVYETL